MKITRINSDKDMDQPVMVIQIKAGYKTFRITETIGGIEINKTSDNLSDNIAVHPCCANVIQLS
jgi:hypothetical protein